MPNYGCGYVLPGSKTSKVVVFKAKNETQARIKMMKFAEENDVYVQNYGREETNKRLCICGHSDEAHGIGMKTFYKNCGLCKCKKYKEVER